MSASLRDVRRVCVYCASSARSDPAHRAAAEGLGRHLAGAGVEIVCGGGAIGSMGALADGALAAGGRVVGVLPRFMLDLEWAHPRLTELVETSSGSGRFEQPTPFGPYVLAVVIEAPSSSELTYAWWWAEAGGTPTEQSKATVSLAG